MRCVKKFAPPFVAAALFVLFAVMVNSTKAQCPCTTEKPDELFTIATETPDATVSGKGAEPPPPDVRFDIDELAREANSPSEVRVIPAGYDLAREALPGHNPKAITEDGLIDLNLDHELARQEVLEKRERIISDQRFKAMTATLDENSEEYEMCVILTQYIFDTIERVENPEENADLEHVEMQRSTLGDAVNDLRRNGGDPEPFRELIERAGGEMDRPPSQSFASYDDCPTCPKGEELERRRANLQTPEFIHEPNHPEQFDDTPLSYSYRDYIENAFDPVTGEFFSLENFLIENSFRKDIERLNVILDATESNQTESFKAIAFMLYNIVEHNREYQNNMFDSATLRQQIICNTMMEIVDMGMSQTDILHILENMSFTTNVVNACE